LIQNFDALFMRRFVCFGKFVFVVVSRVLPSLSRAAYYGHCRVWRVGGFSLLPFFDVSRLLLGVRVRLGGFLAFDGAGCQSGRVPAGSMGLRLRIAGAFLACCHCFLSRLIVAFGSRSCKSGGRQQGADKERTKKSSGVFLRKSDFSQSETMPKARRPPTRATRPRWWAICPSLLS
jgi:hypothetical protein